MNYETMSDEELDRLVAERVMGCKECDFDWMPSTDHNDAAQMRKAIDDRGFRTAVRFMQHLSKIWMRLSIDTTIPLCDVWALIQAPCRYQAIAALMAMEGSA